MSLILWNLTISIRINKVLKNHGINANLAAQRGLIFKYLKVYKDITIKESGKAGSLYSQFIISFVLYTVCLACGIVFVMI